MTLKFFLKKEFIILIFLVITLINPFYYGYRIAVVFSLILFFKLETTLRIFDRNTVYLIFFGIFYHFLSANRLEIANTNLLSILPDIFLPSVMYLTGKEISVKYKSARVSIFFLFTVMFFFTVIPMTSILEQVINYGFNGVRSLYLIWNKDFFVSSTGLGAYFSINMASISLLSTPNQTKFQRIITFLTVVIFLLSIICVFRLGNRTQLLIAGLSFSISIMYNYTAISLKNKISILTIFIILLGYIYFLFTS